MASSKGLGRGEDSRGPVVAGLPGFLDGWTLLLLASQARLVDICSAHVSRLPLFYLSFRRAL